MARVVVEQLVDDIDGGEAAETVQFSYRGVDYEVELSNKNAAKLDKALTAYVEAGRRVRGGRTPSRRSSRGSGSGPSPADVREWARSQGIKVPDRGRVSADVTRQYQEAHS